ncbi:DUF2242 domain-containing protein [Paraburkholderia sp. CNPSo 3274]|uniref:DUF2242 domain-containing protein n=1 Tax=Paraburkholderia sp. CNPSo 3274 TaxID=2940932 RepID=UPI0020B67DEA|nr:DUF2242 domain-containing protein [Paraburkholderia sp. CNPSo 3274]MCP3706072.1 DUF2242 domain-containing protein [Paraburkholderia sp. CNPSo 3274]
MTLAAALGACSSPKPGFQEDQLLSTAPSQFSRSFSYASTDACESSRRALLSQGYMTTMTRNDTVDATKNFQPTMDQHIVVEVHVVCTPGDASNTSMVYVNAVQNGYALKKSDTSASVGLSILGSVSLPIRSNSDEMVKISSETIQSGPFYSRFFDLVGKYLNASARSEPVPGSGAIKISPLPPPIEPVTASAAPAGTTVGSAAPAAAAAAAATGAAVLHSTTLPAAPVVTAPSVAPASAPATATPAPAASAPGASAPVDHGAAAAAAIMGVPATVSANPQAAGLAASVTTHNAATPVAASAPVAAPAQTLASTSAISGSQSVAAETATPSAATATPAASTPSP